MITICEETLKSLLKNAYYNGYNNGDNNSYSSNDEYVRVREKSFETSMTNKNIPFILENHRI